MRLPHLDLHVLLDLIPDGGERVVGHHVAELPASRLLRRIRHLAGSPPETMTSLSPDLVRAAKAGSPNSAMIGQPKTASVL